MIDVTISRGVVGVNVGGVSVGGGSPPESERTKRGDHPTGECSTTYSYNWFIFSKRRRDLEKRKRGGKGEVLFENQK